MTKPTAPLDALRALMKAVERCEDNDYSATSRAALAAAADSATALTAVSPKVSAGDTVVPTSTIKIGKAFSSLVSTLGKDDVSELLMNWNDSELSDDGSKIIVFPGRDRRYSAGELGGSMKAGKGEFLSWLHSDAPLDPAVFEVSEEWKSKVDAARNATGLNAVSPAPTFQAHCRAWSGPLMAPEDAMHRLQQIANDIDRVITECRTLHNDDCTALQAAWSVVNGVVRNIDDEVHSRGLG